MKHRRPPIPVMVLALLVVLAATWYLVAEKRAEDGKLTASGTIEAVQVRVSPELAGRVAEVYVEEGDLVQAGDPLFRLSGELLLAQREVALTTVQLAEAAVQTALAAEASAQAQYDLALAAAQAESAAARAQSWRLTAPGVFDQPGWYFSQSEQITAAQAALAQAEAARREAQSALEQLTDAAGGGFAAAEAELAQARFDLQTAADVLARARLAGDADLLAAAQDAYDLALDRLDAAQKAYDSLLAGDAARRVLEARAALAVADARVQAARDRLLALQTGEQSPRVAAAARGLDQAGAAVEQARLAAAQAGAQLALLDTQISLLIVHAPVNGRVLMRAVQPGELVQPGANAITLIQSGDLTITVYVPEDRYGRLRIGQSATLTADSFPGETFAARIIYISDQAEFTPRNVQTVQGRSSTVYAVRLRIEDPQGKLKAGMPADVVFEESGE